MILPISNPPTPFTKGRIIAEIIKLKQQGKKIVLTEGCFDLLHVGHLHCLQDAKKLGDVLLVVVASDLLVRKLKGCNRPIIKEGQRLELVDNLKCVDYAFLSTDEQDIVVSVKPDIYFKGSEHSIEDITWTKWQKLYGGKCIVSQRPIEMRTTNIIRVIKRKRKSANLR